jgi:hypothetical protein
MVSIRLSVRLSDDVLGAFSVAEPATEIFYGGTGHRDHDHRLLATQVLRLRSWDPGPDEWCQQGGGTARVGGGTGGRGGRRGGGQHGGGDSTGEGVKGGVFFFLGPPSFSWGWLEWRSHGLPTLVITMAIKSLKMVSSFA